MRSWIFPGISKFGLPVKVDTIVAVVIMNVTSTLLQIECAAPSDFMSLQIKNQHRAVAAWRQCIQFPVVQTRARTSPFA